jgi:membrane protease subunit HflK
LPDEQGVVLQFGKYTTTTQPGLNYHIPYPVERVLTPKVTKVNRIEIGYRQSPDNRTTQIRDVPEESLMLTGDENIVDIDFSVFWIINDAGKFLFNVQVPELTIKEAAETSMREVIGQSKIQSIFTEGRTEIEDKARVLIQSIVDDYQMGVTITQVQTQKADPPGEVIDSFRDVQAARADLERQRNEAEAYANDIIPRARGEAEEILQNAEGYKQKVIADSEGKAARFLSIQSEYAKAPVVTKQRIFYETMESVFGDMDKIIIDKNSGQGVLPYLPLPEISKKKAE